MSNQKQFIRMGSCALCRVRGQVVAYTGRMGVCSRCDSDSFDQIGQKQKENWLKTGKVYAE